MGSASFRNCTLTQMAKSWPTFSSGVILRKVLSAHFWPALSAWMGPGCRKRSLLLSLAKQSAAASRNAVRRRFRSMQLTITKKRRERPARLVTGALAVQARVGTAALGCPAEHSSAPALSNLRFYHCDAVRLNGRVVAKPAQPMHIWFPPEPCDLALGIIAMRLLRRHERSLPIQSAAQELHRLLISQRRERARLLAIFREKLFRLGDESFIKHLRGPLVDTRVKNIALRIESKTQNAKAAQRFAPLLPEFGHI